MFKVLLLCNFNDLQYMHYSGYWTYKNNARTFFQQNWWRHGIQSGDVTCPLCVALLTPWKLARLAVRSCCAWRVCSSPSPSPAPNCQHVWNRRWQTCNLRMMQLKCEPHLAVYRKTALQNETQSGACSCCTLGAERRVTRRDVLTILILCEHEHECNVSYDTLLWNHSHYF